MDAQLQQRVIVDLLEQVEELKAENTKLRSASNIAVSKVYVLVQASTC
jgi:hypothetical protein